MVSLDAALDVWDRVDLGELRRKSEALCQSFIALAEERCGAYGIAAVGPRRMEQRGSHVSLRCENGYAVMQALIADKVIGDFRAPDLIRFGFTPLYTRHVDVWDAVDRMHRILAQRLWDKPQFLSRKAVT